MKLADVKLDRSSIAIYSSFEEADKADRLYWHSRTMEERLAALELMRQSAYGYEDSSATGLQRVLEIVKGE